MNFKPISISFLLFSLLYSCNTLTIDNIKFNRDKQWYEYYQGKSKPLRTLDGKLADSYTIDTFWIHQEQRQHKYPYILFSEQSDLILPTDLKLADLFNHVYKDLNNAQYNQVFNETRQIRFLYPKADWYSHLSFLEGYAFEQLQLDSLAANRYREYLSFASQSYSGRLRGYELADKDDKLLIEQRQHAFKFIHGTRTPWQTSFRLTPPMYCINSFQPGYAHQYTKHIAEKTAIYFGFLFGRDINNALALGGQIYYPVKGLTGVYLQGLSSATAFNLTAGIPIQLFLADNHKTGIRLNPYVSLISADSLRVNNTYIPERILYLNYGARLSAGYFLSSQLSIGAYYDYAYYNEKKPFKTSGGLELYRENEFDLSLYYQLIKGISLKTGLKNQHAVIGLFMSGLEISWSLNHQTLFIKSNLY
jgi:hypothetical protein